MTREVVHAPAHRGSVLAAQLRGIGLSLRSPAFVIVPLAATAILVLSLEMRSGSEAIHFHPERAPLLFGLLGLLLPAGIWRGDERSGSGFFWVLPFDRRRHALARVFAGWVWLMVLVAAFVFWMLGLTLMSGASVMTEEALQLLPSPSFRAGSTLVAGGVQTVRWVSQPALWLVPFTAATATYLIGSALALGVRHPVRWLIGAMLVPYFVVAAIAEVNSQWLATPPGGLVAGLFDGRYGLDALLTARTGSLRTAATLPTGDTVVVWRALPEVKHWAVATLIWTGAGLVAVFAAASRHREQR